MKSLIVYYSTYNNNTEKIAKVMAEKINADLFDLKKTKDINIDQYDLIGFGSGIYKESMSPQIYKRVEELDFKNKDIFVFSTSGVGMKFYNNKLKKLLEDKGARCRGSFACKGAFVSRDFSDVKIFEIMSKYAKDHPNHKDSVNAAKFIEKVVSFRKD